MGTYVWLSNFVLNFRFCQHINTSCETTARHVIFVTLCLLSLIIGSRAHDGQSTKGEHLGLPCCGVSLARGGTRTDCSILEDHFVGILSVSERSRFLHILFVVKVETDALFVAPEIFI